MQPYLEVEDIMRILRVSRTTAYGYVRKGRLKFYKVGRLVRIKPRELQKFVERNSSKNKSH